MFSVKIMSIKKGILILEKDLKKKFLELNAAFYSTRRNMCVHIGLNKAIFAYSNFNKIINELNTYLMNIQQKNLKQTIHN